MIVVIITRMIMMMGIVYILYLCNNMSVITHRMVGFNIMIYLDVHSSLEIVYSFITRTLLGHTGNIPYYRIWVSGRKRQKIKGIKSIS